MIDKQSIRPSFEALMPNKPAICMTVSNVNVRLWQAVKHAHRRGMNASYVFSHGCEGRRTLHDYMIDSVWAVSFQWNFR